MSSIARSQQATEAEAARGELPDHECDRPGTEKAPDLFRVENLHVHFVTSRGVVRAVEGISYRVKAGQMVAIVGESGCGKSVSALTAMRLLAKPAGRVVGGRILFEGRDLLKLTDEEMRQIRGRDIAMIFQEPMTSLNPVLTIGQQIMEPLIIHLGMGEKAATARAMELMGLVGITDARRRLSQYPHQFSGGMRQRVMIAIGLACNPKLIIADEPTTALDVTIQAQILHLMKCLSHELGIAMIVITHNLGIVARYADRVNVMYAGQMIEQADAGALFDRPLHPYTFGLLRSVPRLDMPRVSKLETIEGLPPNLMAPLEGCRFAPRCPAVLATCTPGRPTPVEITPGRTAACIRSAEIASGDDSAYGFIATRERPAGKKVHESAPSLLSVRRLKTEFVIDPGSRVFNRPPLVVRAVNDVSFEVGAGRTLGLVGESGCGKTTVGRTILGLERATAGEIDFEGTNLLSATPEAMRTLRRKIQVIFQDPYSSLNPRMTIGQIIAEPMLVHRLIPNRRVAKERVSELLGQVGLYAYMAERYPHELSGGQRQRVGIARALAMEPSFIVCDEPVSALDVSIQAQVINLFETLQDKLGLTFLFIAHDLAVVRHISDRIAVMYLGRIVEIANREDLYRNPRHPYTQALLAAAPIPDPKIERRREQTFLSGEIPSPLAPPSGCVFRTRCPKATDDCSTVAPDLIDVGADHRAACIHV